MKPTVSIYDLTHSYRHVFLADNSITCNAMCMEEPVYELDCPEFSETEDEALELSGYVYAYPDWDVAVITTTVDVYPDTVNAILENYPVREISEEELDYLDDTTMALRLSPIADGLSNTELRVLLRLVVKGFLCDCITPTVEE